MLSDKEYLNWFYDYLMFVYGSYRITSTLNVLILDTIQKALPDLDSNDWGIFINAETVNVKYNGKEDVMPHIKRCHERMEKYREESAERARLAEKQRIYDEWFNNKAFVIPRLSLVE